MGCIGGKAGGSLQLFARFFERRFGALALDPIFGRVVRKFCYGGRQPGGGEMADRECAEQQERTRTKDLPAQLPLPSEQVIQRINANLVGGREARIRIELFVEEQMRSVTQLDAQTPLGPIRRRYRPSQLGAQSRLRGVRHRGQMQLTL